MAHAICNMALPPFQHSVRWEFDHCVLGGKLHNDADTLSSDVPGCCWDDVFTDWTFEGMLPLISKDLGCMVPNAISFGDFLGTHRILGLTVAIEKLRSNVSSQKY